MRHRWRIMVLIVGGGVALGLAIGGLPNQRSDAPFRAPTTTSAPSSTSTTRR